MFLIVGTAFLILLALTLIMLWGHEKIANKRITPRAKVEECWKGEERREHPRFKKDIEVDYSIEKKPHLKNGRTVDISKGGMRLLLDQKLEKGSIIDIKMAIPGTREIIEIEGEIVWTNDADIKDPSGRRFFHSGMKFIAVKKPHGSRLLEYLSSLELEKA